MRTRCEDRNMHARPLRVLTWNLWWRFGPWSQRQGAIAQTLTDVGADVILLQEVWNEPGRMNQADVLATALGYHYTYTTAIERDGVEMGNAIVSRWPLLQAGSMALSTSKDVSEDRCAVHAYVDAPVGHVPVVATHLTWQRNDGLGRQAQVRELTDLIDSMANGGWPPILGGDFNADPDSDEIRMLTGRSGLASERLVFQDAWEQGGDGTDGVTWTPESQHFASSRSGALGAMPWLRRRLDYIFIALPDGRPEPTTAIQVQKAWLVGKGQNEAAEGSDHYAVVADLLPTAR
ncbi:MAG: endonuclease/exonuclease/phosphatase family protein [Pseudonocardiaceae bacterium]